MSFPCFDCSYLRLFDDLRILFLIFEFYFIIIIIIKDLSHTSKGSQSKTRQTVWQSRDDYLRTLDGGI